MMLKTSVFISLCILRDLPLTEEHHGVMQWGEFPLCSHVPMERFFDGTDQENLKTQGEKGQIRKIQKQTRRKEWRKEKEENFYIHGGSHTGVWRFPYWCVLHWWGMSSGYI